MRKATIVLLAGLAFTRCTGSELRGDSEKAPDGRTYLAIMDDNDCGPLRVDGHEWPNTRDPQLVAPGDHTIACADGSSRVSITVREGTQYNFDYWGP